MRDVNRAFCLGFMQYLQYDYKTSQNKPLTPKSAVVYVTCLSTALNAAVRADIINENPFMLLTPQERIQIQFFHVSIALMKISSDSKAVESVRQHLQTVNK